MPQLRPELQNSAFYLYGLDPKSGKKAGPTGTGIVVVRAANTPAPMAHHYAVANWHVAVRGASIIRFNTRDGNHRFIEKEPTDWEFVPGGHDLAACDITEDIRETDDILVQAERSFLTPAIINKFKIGIGEDVFMIGMFADNHGGARNVPAGRFGNLSMLASDQAPVEIENDTKQPSHLVDMRSRGGFSGSPVFIYRTPYSDLSSPTMHRVDDDRTGFLLGTSGQASRRNWFVGLLGIHCGQFWERVEVRKAPQKKERLGDPINEGDVLQIQGGMTIVAPAWRITELLNLEVFEEMRRKRELDLPLPHTLT
jgi:hypothetical protein